MKKHQRKFKLKSDQTYIMLEKCGESGFSQQNTSFINLMPDMCVRICELTNLVEY